MEGMGDAGVAALNPVHAAALRLLQAEIMGQPVLSNWDRLMAYLGAELSRERVEQFPVLFLDNRNRLLASGTATGHGEPHSGYPRECPAALE